jgi:hypothetical protein
LSFDGQLKVMVATRFSTPRVTKGASDGDRQPEENPRPEKALENSRDRIIAAHHTTAQKRW